MFGLFGTNIKYKPKHKKIVQNMQIDDTHPSTLLHDFEAIMSVFREKKQSLTKKHQIPLKLLKVINEHLKNPIDVRLKRPQQKSYPRIEGLYLLLRASGLTIIDETTKTPKLIFHESWYQQWQELNATEQYCNLLESWLIRGNPSLLGLWGGRFGDLPRNLEKISSGFFKFSKSGVKIKDYDHFKQEFSFYPETYNLGLMELFGMIKITEGKPKDGEGWQVKKVENTEIGEALLAILTKEFFGDPERVMPYDMGMGEHFNPLKFYLQDYFPQWQNTMVTEKPELKTGAYIFDVKLYDMWSAKIAIDSTKSLDELSDAILRAVNFDNDHLYKFSIKTRFGTMVEFGHPYMDDTYPAAEISLAETYISEGQKIDFLFDFGDNWEFDLTLDSINPDVLKQVTNILETSGEAPQQYPNWDDEEYDEGFE